MRQYKYSLITSSDSLASIFNIKTFNSSGMYFNVKYKLWIYSVIKTLSVVPNVFLEWANFPPLIWKSIAHQNFTCDYYSICLFIYYCSLSGTYVSQRKGLVYFSSLLDHQSNAWLIEINGWKRLSSFDLNMITN